MNNLHWYAFRTYRNGKKSFLLSLNSAGIQTFVPELFPSLVFLRSEKNEVLSLRQRFFGLAAPYTIPGTTTAAPIPDREMESFRFVLEKGCSTLDPIDVELCQGDKVRVTDGVFKDCEGYIIRIKGNKRFVVKINGVVAVATMYIPKSSLQKVEE